MKWPLSKGISGRINPLVKPSSRNYLALPLMAQIRRSPVEYGESTLLYKVSCIHFRWVLFAGVLNHQQGSTWRVNLLPQLKLMRRFGAVNGGLICIHIRSTLSLRRTSCHWRQGYELTWSGGCVRKPSEAVSWHCWRRKPFLAWSCSLEKGWVLQECPSSATLHDGPRSQSLDP